jgi:hypothetical protein
MAALKPQIRALRAIDRYVTLTNDQLHELEFPDATPNWTRRQTAALVRRGLATRGPLGDGRGYWHCVTPDGQRYLGVPLRRHGALAMKERIADLAIAEHCLDAAPPLVRLPRRRQLRYFGPVPMAALRRPVCRDLETGRLDLMFVRCDLEVAAIVRDCWRYLQKIRRYPKLAKPGGLDGVRLVIITGTDHQMRSIQQTLDRAHEWPVRRLVRSCPSLVQYYRDR